MNKTNDPTPPAAIGETLPPFETVPRKRNRSKRARHKIRQGLKGLPFPRGSYTPEEAARMSAQRRAVAGLLREQREWTRRARTGRFTDPKDGKAYSRADCLARSRRAKEQAALLAGQMAGVGRAVLARFRAAAAATGDAQTIARALLFPISRNRRGRRHAGDGAARPWISPLHLRGGSADADSGGSGLSAGSRRR